MEFNAYLVKMNSNPSINVSLGGVLVFLISIFFWAFSSLETLSLALSCSGFILVIVGAVAGKGKSLFDVDDKFVRINDDGIEIRSVFYAFREITDLYFHFDSYYSQSSYGYFTENAGYIEYGIGNQISFKCKDVEVFERFYLANQEQANSFLLLVGQMKLNKIPYRIDYRNFRI